MRPNLDPRSVAKVHLIGRSRITLPNGTVIDDVDYSGYRATDTEGQTKLFLALNPGDESHDWVDVTEHANNFIVSVTGAHLTDDAK